MSQSISLSTGKSYGLQRVCRVWGISRSTYYNQRQPQDSHRPKQKRGPRPFLSDADVITLVRQTIEDSPFSGEGHRKVHARIRHLLGPVPLGRDRVRRLMRDNQLLSPHRVPQGKARSHDGRITTDKPGLMWATDGAKILTSEDGWVWFFGIIEHWNGECMGWHLTKKGNRFAAMEALGQAVRHGYGSTDAGVARGLCLRMDHGSQFRSEAFLKQVKYWGLTPSFGFVREPETNGVIERFHRTLKEQAVHGRIYKTIEELRQAIEGFVSAYNDYWLLEKLGYQSPRQARFIWERRHAA